MNIKTLLVTVSLATALSGIAQTDGDTIERQISPVPVESADATDSIDSNPVQTESQLTMMADSAYTADNYILAEALYSEAISRFGTSSTLFYNLGNAYYRQGNLGKAIVNYERALKLDPTNADASANLEFVKGKIADRQLDESSILDRLWGNLVTGLKADTWAWVSIILFALFLAGALTYLFSSVVIVKKSELLRRYNCICSVCPLHSHLVCSGQSRHYRPICCGITTVGPTIDHSARSTQPVGRSIPAP